MHMSLKPTAPVFRTIGLGTMTLKGDICVQAVKTALQLGYRHLDTAAFYGNEMENGEGLRASGVKREEVFICTKVRRDASCCRTISPSRSTRASANLKLPYVDLLLIHWNNPDIPFKISIGALCKAKKDGKTKHVGVANFTTTMLDEAWAVTSEPLVCNQIEVHPFINQDKVLAACKKHGMAVVAYCRSRAARCRATRCSSASARRMARARRRCRCAIWCSWASCPIPRTANPGASEGQSRRVRLQACPMPRWPS